MGATFDINPNKQTNVCFERWQWRNPALRQSRDQPKKIGAAVEELSPPMIKI